ncbi:MAG: cytidine deaminase [Candidatus Krumholzibacteria bacterium]|nr:cytidine deaminase [Candidatus Krumholzibacteria bacterium]
MKEEFLQLVEAACEARLRSYSPYSKFRVGAALMGESGTTYPGTNVENASIGLSICAERSAVFRAVTDGEAAFKAIAICADGVSPTLPCGACRQVLVEFGPDLTVLVAGEQGSAGEVLQFSLGELIPHAFETFVDNIVPEADDPGGAS